jgi:hypothetical protein
LKAETSSELIAMALDLTEWVVMRGCAMAEAEIWDSPQAFANEERYVWKGLFNLCSDIRMLSKASRQKDDLLSTTTEIIPLLGEGMSRRTSPPLSEIARLSSFVIRLVWGMKKRSISVLSYCNY